MTKTTFYLAAVLAAASFGFASSGWSQSAQPDPHHPSGQTAPSTPGPVEAPTNAAPQAPAGLPGMMGPGMTMGPEMMRGMMGAGAMPGMPMGPCPMAPGMRSHDLTADEVREILEGMVAWSGHRRLEVGKIDEGDPATLLADIQTVDGSLVERLRIDRRTGQMTFVE